MRGRYALLGLFGVLLITLKLLLSTGEHSRDSADVRASEPGKLRTAELAGVPGSNANAVTADVLRAEASTCNGDKRVTPPDHIVVVVEENHGFGQIIGNPDAAYINSLAATGMLFTNYHALAHPSAPNYLAFFSGSTQGVTEDGTYFFPNVRTLAGELQQAGHSFLGYAESPLARDHAPWLSFRDSAKMARSFREFPTDYAKLPTVSFVSPNLDNDMHDGTVAQGDRWLIANLSGYVIWAATHNSLFVLTFDEDEGTKDNRVATLVVGAGVSAGGNPARADHYSLLRTIQDLYALPPLGASATSQAMDWISAACGR